jgi:diacylglycerol kinase family enzyme
MNPRTLIRALSALSLVLLAAIFVTGLLLVLHNPALAVLFVLGAGAVLAGGWIMLSSRGSRWWWGSVLTILAMLATFAAAWALVANRRNLKLLLLLAILAVIYSALVGWLSRLYWHSRRSAATPTKRYARPALIINPKSGNGRAAKAHLAEAAAEQGVAAIVMQPGQDLVELAESAIHDGAEVVGISGGDGSLGVLAGVAMKHDLPLVVLPGGTRCHFARDIGLNPAAITDALAGFRGVERRVDVGFVADRVVLNNASFGLYAHIINHKDYRSHKLEVTNRVTRELASSNHPYYSLKFTDGNGKPWDHAAQVLVGVNRYETLKFDELGERRRLDEGILQVIAVRQLDSSILKMLTGTIKINSGDAPVAQSTTAQFTISDPSGSVQAGIDGESVELTSPVHIRIAPKALRLLVPAEGQRSRPVKAISAKGAQTLWSLTVGRQA